MQRYKSRIILPTAGGEASGGTRCYRSGDGNRRVGDQTYSMSYDLNVHRQVECFGEDPEREISEAQWQNYVAKHEQLVFSTANPELEVLGDPSSCGPWLRWIGGRIDTQNPSDDFIEVVLDVARDLKAWVHGDDGEQYVKMTF